ncbi:MAG TPA: 50S ribosomal protein L30 [Conexivisphaerales archaeon]|nr:50S ribosomal protein L30 [Conexivisphaerales archaeon]
MAQILVIRLRGTVNMYHDVAASLERLGLLRRYAATIVPSTDDYIGLLRKASAFVAWSEVDKGVIAEVLKARGELRGSKPIDADWLKARGFKDVDELAAKIADGSIDMRHIEGLKPFFRLHPPLKGFRRSTNKHYGAGGMLAQNPELPKLVERMI